MGVVGSANLTTDFLLAFFLLSAEEVCAGSPEFPAAPVTLDFSSGFSSSSAWTSICVISISTSSLSSLKSSFWSCPPPSATSSTSCSLSEASAPNRSPNQSMLRDSREAIRLRSASDSSSTSLGWGARSPRTGESTTLSKKGLLSSEDAWTAGWSAVLLCSSSFAEASSSSAILKMRLNCVGNSTS